MKRCVMDFDSVSLRSGESVPKLLANMNNEEVCYW